MIFEAELLLSILDFFDEVMHKYGFYLDDVTPNAVNKIVEFELESRALCVLTQF